MTKELEESVEAVRRMPPADQNTIAQAMKSMARIGEAGEKISADDLAAVLEGEAQIERGEVVEGGALELVAAAFDRHRH